MLYNSHFDKWFEREFSNMIDECGQGPDYQQSWLEQFKRSLYKAWKDGAGHMYTIMGNHINNIMLGLGKE
jgi:Leu/Phe-tRNA-protein transferase